MYIERNFHIADRDTGEKIFSVIIELVATGIAVLLTIIDIAIGAVRYGLIWSSKLAIRLLLILLMVCLFLFLYGFTILFSIITGPGLNSHLP